VNSISAKSFILTGAAGGIGRALALALAAEGCGLVLNGRRTEPLEVIRRECEKAGARVEVVAGSSAIPEVCDALVKKGLELDNFYGFIHAAGVLHPGPVLHELATEEFRDIFEASVAGSFQMARAAFPKLIEAGGGVAVFFGSGAAEKVLPGMGAYCAAKAAEEHLARQLAAETPQVVSMVFRPGVVDTPMVQEAFHAVGKAGESLREQFLAFERNGEIHAPEIPARALVSILKNDPRRFQGKIATWRDGV
jgi:NAD(P)-dependent dehydrogenase (short-subunit alcohol dehydrogenase family)